MQKKNSFLLFIKFFCLPQKKDNETKSRFYFVQMEKLYFEFYNILI